MRRSCLVLAISALVCFGTGDAEGQEDVLPPASGGLDFANVEPACEQPITLPEPAGHHQVGVVTYHWIDRARPNELTPDPHDDRPLIATVFYPALRAPDGPPAPYIPELDLLREGFRTDRRNAPRDIAAGLATHGCVLTSAYESRPIDPSRARYPVALVSPGGNMSRHWHTALAQELASQGWVTAILSHAHSGLDVFPRMGFTMSSDRWEAGEEAGPGAARRLDDELADILAGDASFTLDRLGDLAASDARGPLTGALDLERVAIIGHSRGGSTVARGCSADERFDACVTYDNIGPDREREAGLDRPQLVIRASWDADRVRRLHEFLGRNRTVALDVELAGAGHMSFTDLPFIEPDRYEVVPLSSARAHEATAAITLAFLDAHVLGGPGDPARVADRFEPATLRRFGRSGGASPGMRGHAGHNSPQPPEAPFHMPEALKRAWIGGPG